MPDSLGHRLPGHSTLIPISNDAPGASTILGRQRARNHEVVGTLQGGTRPSRLGAFRTQSSLSGPVTSGWDTCLI